MLRWRKRLVAVEEVGEVEVEEEVRRVQAWVTVALIPAATAEPLALRNMVHRTTTALLLLRARAQPGKTGPKREATTRGRATNARSPIGRRMNAAHRRRGTLQRATAPKRTPIALRR